MSEITEEQFENFVSELEALTRRTGIVVGGCGCCGSPYLYPLSTEDHIEDGGYTCYTEENWADQLRWTKINE
mgnify:CR=1 FL=1